MKSIEVRKNFLKFFQKKIHKIIPSVPIVLKDDPSLFFVNAGMNPFKNYFLGNEKPPYTRIVDSQKCLRVTGKHNDIDDVGNDTYHHTMFEMLGNWSFGDYFKKEAISWAWELLTEKYKISEENLYVTFFNGEPNLNLPADEESYNYWREILNKNRIIPFGKKDNFWEMGFTGPCGPCSEIHIDLRNHKEKAKKPASKLINKGHPHVIEIWNLVFIEFFLKSDNSLYRLPDRHIDTGMGLERLCRILQKKSSNYETDLFLPLIRKIEKCIGKKYGEDKNIDISMQVLADHIRAVSFAISEGQNPSNTGVGYVIRRILRRALGFSFRFLDKKQAFIYKLVDTLSDEMGEIYPDIFRHKASIKKIVKEEENIFLKTINQGIIRMNHLIKEYKNKKEKLIDGVHIFELYDTYGFPLDFSRILARENDLKIDKDGFEKEMLKQKKRSKKGEYTEKFDWIVLLENSQKENCFLGYDQLEIETKIRKFRKMEDSSEKYFQIVFDQTPFYPEVNGQLGDTGWILNSNYEEKIHIFKTKKEENLIVHLVKNIPLHPLKFFKIRVDAIRRRKIEKNHTAIHLLHYALSEILGIGVRQKGSYIGPDRLRFDFSHSEKLSVSTIDFVEDSVNKMIQEKLTIEEKKEARREGGRCIRFGNSVELCSGTHVSNTEHIEYFKILSESSISSGIRRIEAITSIEVVRYLKNICKKYNVLLEVLNFPNDPIKKIKNLLDENKIFKSQLKNISGQKMNFLKKKLYSRFSKKFSKKVSKKERLEYLKLIVEKTDLNTDSVKKLALELRREIPSLIIILVCFHSKKKVVIFSAISDNLIHYRGMSASAIVQYLATNIRVKFGGKSFFAEAKVDNLEGLEEALRKAKLFINSMNYSFS
ncbi:MAG TPA: alanine--tRNA ligase [Candidatus Angelobacter sp.]|jgi:alanyl-tRNA synthetase|nr:alanine--tRNA ligase [Candidatus Angelobacter sp.]